MNHLAHEANDIGARLRSARETLGLTQSDVAEHLEVPRTAIVAIEAGTRRVTAAELDRLASLYRRSSEWLLGREPSADVEASAVLYRMTQDMTDLQRKQVLRFAEFIASGAEPSAGPAGELRQ